MQVMCEKMIIWGIGNNVNNNKLQTSDNNNKIMRQN